jgi:Transglutaminase-like superfamily
MALLNPRIFLALFVCLAFQVSAVIAAEGDLKSFTQVITSGQAEYTVEVGGSMDPENVEIVIENLGDTPTESPRITVNGLYDWYDIQSMAEEITAGCTTDEEKALTIWEWIHWKRFQRSPVDESSANPVRAMNGYGYGICGHSAVWYMALCKQAGLDARMQEIWGHTVNEVYFNGAWHFMDTNVKVFYLGRDNRTIASLAELEKDSWLIERTIHPRDPWAREKDPPSRNREFVRYITTTRDNYVQHDYDEFIKKEYDMSFSLRPGEKLIRWWKPVLKKYEARDKRPLEPERYANGQLVWEPDLKKTDIFDCIEVIENITTSQRDGSSPAIHVADPHDRTYTRPARFTIPINSAYPIVGGRFSCKLEKQGRSGNDMAGVYFGTPGWSQADLYTFRWGTGTRDITLDLDYKLLNESPAYDYKIGFALKANGEADPPTQTGVDWFKSTTDLQVSPHSLPALAVGKNTIRYRDNSTASPRKIRITHTWRETSGNHCPGRVTEALAPANPGTVKKLSPTLKWSPATDPDKQDSVVDYQVKVSLRPDCRWPVSMTLYRNVGSDKCEWKVPESFLNPGTTYYWTVRARDNKGNVGQWGEIFSFTTTKKAR